MAGQAWLVDGNRFATKIKSACDPDNVVWKSNPTKACPRCHHVIDNNDMLQQWPGLPKGVKFDPSDQEIIWHLLAKTGASGLKPHPFINEFIPTVDEDEGICYTHPQNLPGVKKDGSVSHFFHRAIKAYNTGTRKRRKIQGFNFGDVRWHKTGKTKPVILDGVQRGCKKIMVLYMSMRGGKSEKTNWVMHQFHLGREEEEKDGEYVVSKVFYQQQQQVNWYQKPEDDASSEGVNALMAKVVPPTPKSMTPDPPRCLAFDVCDDSTIGGLSGSNSIVASESIGNSHTINYEHVGSSCASNGGKATVTDQVKPEDAVAELVDYDNCGDGESRWWESLSQNLLDSQQLVEGLCLCDDLLQSQSPRRDENGNLQPSNRPCLADYAKLGPEDLKRDLEECQNLVLDPENVELDTPPEFRLSQLEFGSQDSFIAWGGGNMAY